MDKITDNVLLCIFDGRIETVDIHLKPEAVHFGFNRPIHNDPNSICHDYYKDQRDKDGTEKEDENHKSIPISIVWKNGTNSANAFRIVDILKMEKNYKANPPKNSVDFALRMIEGGPKVRYIIS